MNARERLNTAQSALREGRYAEALDGLLWFHANALGESDAWYGVRLSYALNDWRELAGLYPPAMAALCATRTATAAALLRGEADRHGFNDVESIDKKLGQNEQTYALYLLLEEQQPELAEACGRRALDAIISMGDFERAGRIARDPETAIRRAYACMHQNFLSAKGDRFSRAPTRWAFINIYLDHVKQALAIAHGLGQFARASALAQLAVKIVQNPSIRHEVSAGLIRECRPPSPEIKRHRLQDMRVRQRATSDRRRARMQRGF